MSVDNAYKDGDIVWVKLGNNWWPGEVISHEDRLPEGFSQLKKKPFCVVKFFQEDAYEYPKNAKQVYPFQCAKKDEFIKKGLALYNAKNAFMEKFPEDVKYAESQTKPQTSKNLLPFVDDRSNSIVKAVLSDGRLRKSIDYYESGQADISGGRNSREQSVLRRDSATITANVTTPNRAPFGSSTSMLTPSTVTGNSVNANSACQYRCNICDFTTMRQNVLIMHRKSHSSGGGSSTAMPQRSNLSLAKPRLSNSIIVSSSISNEESFTAVSTKPVESLKTTSLSKQGETISVQRTSLIEEPTAAELTTPKRSRKKLSVSPNSVSKRSTRSTPHLETDTIDAEQPLVTDEVVDKATDAERPKHTEKIRERLLADWSDEEKDEAEHFANLAKKTTVSSPEKEGIENLQLPTTSSKSQTRRRTPTIVPMTALEGAGQTLVVGAITQSTETATKPPRIRNIPKKDRLRDFEKSIDAEVITDIKPTAADMADTVDAHTSTSTVLVSLIKSAEKQKSRARSRAEVSEASGAATSTLSCFDFQEEEEHESDVLKSIAKFKKKYYSPEKDKQKNKEESEQKTSTTQRDLELSAEIDNLLEATNDVTELKTDAVPVKGLPIKERGKRIFKSRNRSRLDDDDEDATPVAQKQVEIQPETDHEETAPKVERRLRGRSTPQNASSVSPINGKALEGDAAQPAIEGTTTTATTITPTPKRRNRKTHNNRIMQQLIDEEEASIPFIRHSPVELYSCDVAADVSVTLVRERGRRSKTSTPNSLTVSRDEIVNGNNGGNAGGSRASSRNFNAPPLTPTDETSSFGISEAGAEFGSPASSLDEERLLTPLDETTNESEFDNDSERFNYNESKKPEKASTELAEDDDEIESPIHEALSSNELDSEDLKSQTKKRLRSPKKKTESKKQKAIAEVVPDRQTFESTVIERDSPKRSLRQNRRVEPIGEEIASVLQKTKDCNQRTETAKIVEDTPKITPTNEDENEKNVSKKLWHRKTRTTKSKTPTIERKVETPTLNASTDDAEKGKETNRRIETKHKRDNTENLVTDNKAILDAKKAQTLDNVIEKTIDVASEPLEVENATVNAVLEGHIKTDEAKLPAVDEGEKEIDAQKAKEQNSFKKKPYEHAVAELSNATTSKEKASGKAENLLIANQDQLSNSKEGVLSKIADVEKESLDKTVKKERLQCYSNSEQTKSLNKVPTAEITKSSTSPSINTKDSRVDTILKSESPKYVDKKEISEQTSSRKIKTPVDDIHKLKESKHHADNGKQSPSNSGSRKRRAELDEPTTHKHKTKKEDITESPKLGDERKHQHKSGKRDLEADKEKESHEKTRPSSPKKHHKLQTSFDVQPKAAVCKPSSTSSPPAVEITRINVDVANPLSKHPSIVASMLAASSSTNAGQQRLNSSKCRSPKHKMISPLKRKLSHEIIGQNVDANNDAVVAHVQSLCPQVKITRKERLIEPIVDTAMPEKLLATPKKSLSPQSRNTPPDISQMPIVLSNETVEVASPPGLVSSNLWQTDLLQPPPPNEQLQTPPQKKAGFDPRGQKYVMHQSSTEQLSKSTAVSSPSGNGRLSPQKPQSTSVTGVRKQTGNAPSVPVKQQQQHKFAEALALADSILAPSVKPSKRRSSQQTVSNSSTITSNAASSNRRFSSAAAVDTKPATPPAKIPKYMSKEVRSKSSSPTKMQSGNGSGSGSGSNSPAPKSRLQTQHPVQKQQKQTETPSDENNETTQITKTTMAASPASTPTTTLITAAADDAQTVVEAEQLNSAAKITAVPIQPIPGYAETFMLCMFVDDVYKPINNIPHYLNKDLNQLVPVPPEAYEGILPEFVVEQQLGAVDGDVAAATNLNASSTTTTPSGKSTSIVCSREGGETLMETNDENELRVGLQLDETLLVGNADAAAIAVDADAVEAATDNAIVLKLENQHIILDAASFEQLLANPDANTQLLLEDGTEFVLTREVLAALKAQHDDQTAELLAIPGDQHQQQHLHDQLIATEAGTSADLLSVALANSEFYGGEMLQIETTLGLAGGADAAGLQLLASDGSIVFQAPPLPQAHLTPPITAHTSETNAVLNQTPIMSTLEKPSTGKAAIEASPTAVAAVVDGDLIGARPNLDDSLAVIGVTTQSSTVPSSLELPITITNPAIAPKVSLAGAHAAAADLVQFQPRRSVATAAVAASSSIANVSHIYDDSIDNIN